MTSAILYIEIPHFYAEVERVRNPMLARPVVVGGHPRRGGVVQAATPDARARGVAAGMSMLQALEVCPEARAFRTDMAAYREVGERVLACIRRTHPELEAAELGTAYLVARPPAEPVAEDLRRRVRDELGLPLRVGIAPAKYLARMAAAELGDEGIFALAPDGVADFLRPQPVRRLEGVGEQTASLLAAHGVHTVGELADLGRGRVQEILGVRGLDLLDQAQGRDDTPVRPASHARSLSQEVTLAQAEIDTGALGDRLEELARSLERRLGRQGLAAARLALKLRYADQEATTRSQTLDPPISQAAEIHARALALLRRTQAGSRPVKLLGLSLSRLGPGARSDRQLELFPPEG